MAELPTPGQAQKGRGESVRGGSRTVPSEERSPGTLDLTLPLTAPHLFLVNMIYTYLNKKLFWLPTLVIFCVFVSMRKPVSLQGRSHTLKSQPRAQTGEFYVLTYPKSFLPSQVPRPEDKRKEADEGVGGGRRPWAALCL